MKLGCICALLIVDLETSKRGTTHQREKIKRKVKDTRKKRQKEAKKNPQWKSSASSILLLLRSILICVRAKEGSRHPE